MGSSSTLLVFVILLGIGQFSVFAEDAENDANDDIGGLLAIFSDAKRLDGRSRDSGTIDLDELAKTNPDAVECFKLVYKVTDDGAKTMASKRDVEVEDCVAECIIRIKLGNYVSPEDFKDQECLLDGTEERETGLEDVLQRNEKRIFKKIGAWFRKNKDKIIKGLKTAIRIIGGIIQMIGKK